MAKFGTQHSKATFHHHHHRSMMIMTMSTTNKNKVTIDKVIVPLPLQRIQELRGIGETLAEKLEQLNIKYISDLLFHLPTGFVDRTKKQFISEGKDGNYITVELAVKKVHSGSPNRVYCEDLKGDTVIINQFCGSNSWSIKEWSRLKSTTYIIGGTVIVSGKLYRNQQINNPDLAIPVRSLEDLQKADIKYVEL